MTVELAKTNRGFTGNGTREEREFNLKKFFAKTFKNKISIPLSDPELLKIHSLNERGNRELTEEAIKVKTLINIREVNKKWHNNWTIFYVNRPKGGRKQLCEPYFCFINKKNLPPEKIAESEPRRGGLIKVYLPLGPNYLELRRTDKRLVLFNLFLKRYGENRSVKLSEVIDLYRTNERTEPSKQNLRSKAINAIRELNRLIEIADPKWSISHPNTEEDIINKMDSSFDLVYGDIKKTEEEKKSAEKTEKKEKNEYGKIKVILTDNLNKQHEFFTKSPQVEIIFKLASQKNKTPEEVELELSKIPNENPDGRRRDLESIIEQINQQTLKGRGLKIGYIIRLTKAGKHEKILIANNSNPSSTTSEPVKTNITSSPGPESPIA